MTKEQKHEQISNAMRYTGDGIEKCERPEIYVMSDSVEKGSELYEIIFRNVWTDNIGGNADLSYAIVADACSLIADTELEDLNEDTDDIFYENESASVYTDERLGYLNMNNQYEISEKMKDLSLDDISTACAVWYDDMVRSVALELRDYILND